MENSLKRACNHRSGDNDTEYTLAFGSRELQIPKTSLEKCKTLSEWLKENPNSTRVDIVESGALFHAQDLCMLFACLDGSFKLQNLKHIWELIPIANAADYLDCDVVLDAIAVILDQRIAGKSVEEMRKQFVAPVE